MTNFLQAKPVLFTVLFLTLTCYCAGAAPDGKTSSTAKLSIALPDRVLLVQNQDSTASIEIATFYREQRHVRNLLQVRCPDSAATSAKETLPYKTYCEVIEKPVAAYLARHPEIDFIVLTKGIPLRVTQAPTGLGGGRASLDSCLAALDYAARGDTIKIEISDSGFKGACWFNRYWNAKEPFSHARFGGYLVTRLDGFTVSEAKGLVTQALAAERQTPRGPFLLDTHHKSGMGDLSAIPARLLKVDRPRHATLMEMPYKDYNADLVVAGSALAKGGFDLVLQQSAGFTGSDKLLAGYCSWGSNDPAYNAKTYRALRFVAGALAETAVSTSARTFFPASKGQSLIADLIRGGVTGVKGYCDEPFLIAIASPTILFDRYTRGWTLAESFYAASRFVGWEDIVIGDPLCRPYARRKQDR